MTTERQLALVVEDEPEIAELIRFHLERDGLEVHVAADGRLGLDAIRARTPTVILLDLMLPGMSGLQLCQRVRAAPATASTPIIMVTAKGSEADIVAGLEAGADDYVTKPFSPHILTARVRAAMRRLGRTRVGAQAQRERSELFGGRLIIDAGRHVVSAEGKPVDLTITEFQILQFLAARPGFVRTRDQIISAVHGSSTVLSKRTIDVHVTAIRRKLGAIGAAVETVRGVGYRLAEVSEPDAARATL